MTTRPKAGLWPFSFFELEVERRKSSPRASVAMKFVIPGKDLWPSSEIIAIIVPSAVFEGPLASHTKIVYTVFV
ncbi:MAG: hypothetical protein WCE52_15930 [Candidatus Acidiferrum sp.]